MGAELQIQLRRDTAANWTTNDPTLAAGEFGLETDTGFIKLGDGATAWTSLSYDWFFGNDVTVDGNLDVVGNFSSLGINDNATAERIEITDTKLKLGGSSAIAQILLAAGGINASLSISGGAGTGTDGANISLYSTTHSTQADDLLLLSGANIFMHWDESFGSLAIRTGIGAKTHRITINDNGIDIVGGYSMAERADHAFTPFAGYGEVWLRNDVNQTLMFTDDQGNDYELGGADTTVDWRAGTETGFHSIGIDDNATGERFELQDTYAFFGTDAVGTDYFLGRVGEDGSLSIGGADSVSAGAVHKLYSGMHATQAGDWEFKVDGSIKQWWDESAGQMNFNGPIVGGSIESTLSLIQSAGPAIVYIETGAALDQKQWLDVKSGETSFRYIRDDVGTNPYFYESIYRSGTGAGVQVDSIYFAAANHIGIESGDLRLKEQADHSSFVFPTYGFLWVKNDTPNTLQFTDDAGTDWTLNTASVAIDESAATGLRLELTDTYAAFGGIANGYDIRIGSPSLSTGSASLNLGAGRAGNGPSFVDLISDATYTDYGARFYRGAGANDVTQIIHRGIGDLSIETTEAADIDFKTTNIVRMTIDSGGDIDLFNSIKVGAGIRLTERADHALTPTATFGEIWLKDGATQALMFTDDAGTDYDLTAAGGAVGGSTTELLYNNAGTEDGIAEFTFNNAATTTSQLQISAISGLTTGAVLELGNTVSGSGITLDARHSGTGGYAARFYGGTNNRTVPVVQIWQDGASGTAGLGLEIRQDQLTPHMELNGVGLGIDMIGGILISERSDHANTPAAGKGEIWLKNTTPNTLIFTDDAGTDHDLTTAGSPWTYTLQTGTSYTASAGDFVVASNTGTVTITLPSGHSVNDTIIVKKTGSGGTVTVDGNVSETIDGATTYDLTSQYESITLISDGTNWLIV